MNSGHHAVILLLLEGVCGIFDGGLRLRSLAGFLDDMDADQGLKPWMVRCWNGVERCWVSQRP
jgi:hypothetical protein